MNSEPTIREQSYAYFLQEAPQLLQVLEQELLLLRDGWSINKVHTLMRATHTLKGAAASVGLESIKQVAHSLEDIFKNLCKPDLAIDPEAEALLFEAYECLRAPLMAELTGSHSGGAEILDRAATIFSQLQEKLGDCFDQEAYIPTSTELGFDMTQSIFEVGVSQRLEEIARILADAEPQQVASTLQTQAEVFLGLAESLNLPGFGAIASTTITALAKHPDQAVSIAQAALEDFQQGKAAVLSGDRTSGGSPSVQLQELAEIGAEGAGEAGEEIDSLLEAIWTIPDEDEADTANENETQLEILPVRAYEQQNASTAVGNTVRVNIKHLERLNYLLGELLTNQNRQSLQDEQLQNGIQELIFQLQQHQQMLKGLQDWFDPLPQDEQTEVQLHLQSLVENADQLQAITEIIDLSSRQSSQLLEKQSRLLTSARDEFLEAQMVPLSEITSRLPRALQHLATLHRKPVQLKLDGTDVLVDKAVAERLYDPLLHLVRNAFDHGIEPIEVRARRGKTRTGQIEIRAFHQGSHLMIEVRDDGQGLNFEQIRQRAVEHHLVSEEEANYLSEAQLMDLLFEPGFSTVKHVSNLSGRGIGLDVVRTQLQALQGAVTVYSQLHRGTTFLLQIPFSLTIAKLFLCQANSSVYAVLADTVEQIILPQADQISLWQGRKVLKWGDSTNQQFVPVYQLEQVLNYFSPVTTGHSTLTSHSFAGQEQMRQIMLLRYQDQLLALEVNQIIGEQELVIRPLDPIIVPPSYVYGGSIGADGQLALVIDGAALTEYILHHQSDNAQSKLAATARTDSVMITPQIIPPLPKLETKVLVVDDSLTWRQTLAHTLQNFGYQVFQVDDGDVAIEQLQLQPDIELIICDLEMPHMHGLEFLHYRQQDPNIASIPIIVLTASEAEHNRRLAIELGATVYMNKPYLEQELLATVANLLK